MRNNKLRIGKARRHVSSDPGTTTPANPFPLCGDEDEENRQSEVCPDRITELRSGRGNKSQQNRKSSKLAVGGPRQPKGRMGNVVSKHIRTSDTAS